MLVYFKGNQYCHNIQIVVLTISIAGVNMLKVNTIIVGIHQWPTMAHTRMQSNARKWVKVLLWCTHFPLTCVCDLCIYHKEHIHNGRNLTAILRVQYSSLKCTHTSRWVSTLVLILKVLLNTYNQPSRDESIRQDLQAHVDDGAISNREVE